MGEEINDISDSEMEIAMTGHHKPLINEVGYQELV
jgi:hypothetical protein